MRAKTKRMLAGILSAVMLLSNMPYGGSLTVYATTTNDNTEQEQQLQKEETSEENSVSNEENGAEDAASEKDTDSEEDEASEKDADSEKGEASEEDIASDENSSSEEVAPPTEDEVSEGTVEAEPASSLESSISTRASERKRIAYFSFDNETDGFTGDGAAAAKQNNPGLSEDGWRGQSLSLSGTQYLTVAADDSSSLLTGLEGVTVSYYSKASGGAGWSFYAAPNSDGPTYNNENYLGILDKSDGNVSVESFISGRNSDKSSGTSTGNLSNEWRHVAVTFDNTGVRLYIDGQFKSEGSRTTASSISDMLGGSSIIQIGRAQWGSGEYYNGLIDEFSIYDYVMSAEEIKGLYEDSFKDTVNVTNPIMLAHYTFNDIASEDITEGTAVPADTTVPNTSTDTQDKNYDAKVINAGAELYEEGSALLLPGGAANSNPAYVELPSGMFLDENNKMIDDLTINIWMKNLSTAGDWAGVYVGTDALENPGNNTRPLNYLLLNPRKGDKFKATMTRNYTARSDPYNGEQTLTEGTTWDTWQMYTVVVGQYSVTTYLDGKPIGRRTHSMKMSDWTADGTDAVPEILAYIGKGGYTGDSLWNGAVKECSIYNYQLPADDIEQLYKDGQEKKEEIEPLMLAHYTFDDIAAYEGNASFIDKGKVLGGAIVPNTSADTSDKAYNAAIHGDGASLRAGGVGLELPGGSASSNSAYVELPSAMFKDSKGKMLDELSINIWMQNISGQSDWTGLYVGTDPAANQDNVPLNYLLLNPRKNDKFKVAMTHNKTKTGSPYSGEDQNINGTTDDWWQMYTVVINDKELTTYLDGNKLATVNHTMKMSEWTADGTDAIPEILAYIGKGGYIKDAKWRGAIKECSIYNYELTQEAIAKLYDEVHTADESAEALVTAVSVSADFLQDENSASIYYGDSYELPSKTTVTLSDGSSNAAYVTWYDQNGNKVTDTSLLEAGTYSLTGRLENYFPAPFIEERADPQVYYDETSGKYYFTSSWPAYGAKDRGYDKIVIRQADTLIGLADAEEHTIWTAPGEKYTGRYHIWAPELHHIGSKWYCYFAGTLSGDWDIRPRVLVCDDTKDITDAGNWTEHDRFMNKDGEETGVSDAFALDMTYFENNNKHYVIWAYKPVGSELLMGEVSKDDPTKLIGDPMVLTYPEYAWECAGNQNVDEGPSVLKKNGRIYVVFSAAATGDMYCMGMISAPADSDLMDITNWTKSPTPVLQTKDLKGQYGPGHNSFTVDEDGNAILVYHARDEECHTNNCGYSNVDSLYDPCRNAMLAYVRYDADGNPIFNSTADKELENLDTSQLTYTLTVENMTEASAVADYALVTDAKDSVSAHEGTLQGDAAEFDKGLIISAPETGNLVNYLDLSDNTDLLSKLESSKGITITAWVRNDTQNTNNNNRPTVFSLGHDDKNYFAFSTGNWGKARATFYVNNAEVTDSAGKTGIQYNTSGMQDSILGDWYPIAITLTDRSSASKSQTRVRYYMNDELLCTVDTPASLKDLGGLEQFYIGGGAGTYHDMYGGIRNVKIYDKALSTELIAKYDKDYLADNLAIIMGADLETHAISTGDSLQLPLTGHPGVTYTWQSSDTTIMDNNGTVTPSSEESRQVTLTAAIHTELDNEYEETVTFPVTVLDTYSFWLNKVYEALTINNIDDVRGSLYLPLASDEYPEVTISWTSDNTSIITDHETDGIAAGLVTRPDDDTDVKLTATISVGEGTNLKERTKEFTAKVKKKAQVGEFTDYMFAYFIGEGSRTGEQMYFADSRDGLHWTALNDGEPVLTSQMGEKGLRDPFIMRSHEGDKFYLIATDLWIAGGTSWGDSQTKGSQSIMVWESTDLVNWSEQRMCKVAVDTAGCTWAPEAFWDEDSQDYIVFWASKTSDDNFGPHHIWKCHTRDFYTYSEPEIWITLKNASGNDISVIDTTVIKDGDTYYRFSKNEDGGTAVMTDNSTINTKVVYMEKSNSLSGSWEYVPSAYLLDSSNQYREGATCFKFNDEDVDVPTWCLLLDNFGGGGYYPATTTDMGSGNFTKLSASEYSFPTTGILRHGSVLNITADEYAALEKKWGPFVEEEVPPATTLEEARIASFTFDDDDNGFKGSGAIAEQKGTINLSEEVRDGASGKSAKLDNGSWMDVKTKDGGSLLTGVESMSISYYSKGEDANRDGAGWTFFAAPNANAPVYNSSENYLGVIDHIGEVRAERYHGTRNSSTSTSASVSSLDNVWRHVVVSYTPKSVKIYIDGELKATSTRKTLSDLSELLGNSSILQLGKGNWGNGEYYNGYIDDVTIYNRALTQDEISDIFTGKVPMPGPDDDDFGEVLPEDVPKDKEIPNGLWIAGIDEEGYPYTGKAVKPEVRVYNYKTLLKLKTDYTIAYKNNVKANDASAPATAPTITVTGRGNYSGKDTSVFKILKKNITDGDVSITDIALAYKNNKVQKPVPTVKWGKMALKNKRDFTVEYPSTDLDGKKAYVDPGDWSIKITGDGNYTGIKNITLTIADQNAKLTGKLNVTKIPNQVYTGNPLEPELEVKDGRATLTKGTHYEVTYENNTEIGTATAIITGKTNKESGFSYVGEKRVTFKITGTDMKTVKVTSGLDKSYTYTGKDIEPVPTLTVSVKENGSTVTKTLNATDYDVEYYNNLKAGRATITFTGKGAYTGILKKTFMISAYDITTDEAERVKVMDIDDVPYAKKGSKPKPVVTYKISEEKTVTLEEGIDYTLSYSKNTKLNDCTGADKNKWPTVTVKGKGNYKGLKKAAYKIVQQNIGNLQIQVEDKVFQNKPNKYKSVPKVIDLDGKALSSGTDYEKAISYAYAKDTTLSDGTTKQADTAIGDNDILPAGTEVKVTVTAKTNYTGTISGTYRITAKSISRASVKVNDQIYTGSEIRPDKTQITKISVGTDNLQDDDYEILYYDKNVKKGTAKMTICGVGNYGGTKTVSFKIKAKPFVWWKKDDSGT